MSEPKKKPRGKPFTGKDDARRHKDGTKSAANVAFNRSLREIIAGVGNEQITDKNGAAYSRVELMVRGLYVKAAKGDVSAFNALVERVEGKVPQQNEITGKDGSDVVIRVIRDVIKNGD